MVDTLPCLGGGISLVSMRPLAGGGSLAGHPQFPGGRDRMGRRWGRARFGSRGRGTRVKTVASAEVCQLNTTSNLLVDMNSNHIIQVPNDVHRRVPIQIHTQVVMGVANHAFAVFRVARWQLQAARKRGCRFPAFDLPIRWSMPGSFQRRGSVAEPGGGGGLSRQQFLKGDTLPIGLRHG